MTSTSSTQSASPPEHQSAQTPRRFHLLVRSTTGRPAIVAGLRTAVATVVPLLVSEVLQLGAAGTWASLGGFSAAVADRGGVYRIRAFTMGWLTMGAAIGVALGGLIGGNGWIAVPITFLVVGALSLLRAYGVSAGGVGSSIAVAFAISLAAPAATPLASLWRGAYLLAGGAWAMFLALVLWPIRPFSPAPPGDGPLLHRAGGLRQPSRAVRRIRA